MALLQINSNQIRGGETNIFDYLSPSQIAGVIANTAPDCTAEITTALATGKNLYFPAGTYGHTGGLVQDDNAHKGQSVRGSGDGTNANGSGGQVNVNATIFKKLSGSLVGYQFDSDFATLSDIRFDNNGLDGICLKVSIHNSRMNNIACGNMKAATTDSTLQFQSVNVSTIDTINFFDYNYLPIEFNDTSATLYGSLYSEYRNIVIGNQGGACVYGMLLSGFITSSFYNCVFEETIRFNNNCNGVNFYATTSEGLPVAKSLISFSSASENNIDINFFGLRVNSNSGDRGATALIESTNAVQLSFEGVEFYDQLSAAPVFISLNQTRQFSIKNCVLNTANDYTFINCIEATYYNENIVVDNCESKIGLGGVPKVGTNYWTGYSKAVSVSNSSIKQVFNYQNVAKFSYAQVTCTNITGRITINAGYAQVAMSFNNCREVLDDDGWAYLTNCVLQNGIFVGNGKAKSAILTLAAAGSYTWASSIPQSCIIKNVTLFNIADTGQNYNVGNANIGATAFGSNVSKAIGTAQFSQSYVTLYPLYNPNSGADDLVLTATAGNFTAGATVRACIVTEPLGWITS